ncbi:unnamed protein product [Ambrosiozyma monospora]|uniref:Unnamed protein product n=1 Tax=Ambrosiozyma monospora TaxID=43982 RepID=A0A9W7DI37_AMBMO|nr:unnamed protein product [Ambrosiozyma monospora]
MFIKKYEVLVTGKDSGLRSQDSETTGNPELAQSLRLRPVTSPFVTYHLFLDKINPLSKWEFSCLGLYKLHQISQRTHSTHMTESCLSIIILQHSTPYSQTQEEPTNSGKSLTLPTIYNLVYTDKFWTVY